MATLLHFALPATDASARVCLWPIVLQKDFGPRSEEHFFQIRPQERSLIQKFGLSDSNIARFWRSGGCRRLLQHNPSESGHSSARSRCQLWPQGDMCSAAIDRDARSVTLVENPACRRQRLFVVGQPGKARPLRHADDAVRYGFVTNLARLETRLNGLVGQFQKLSFTRKAAF